jgi:hypothetical protein
MRAVVVKEFGPIASHSIGELPDPSPRPAEVLVTIKATAVNYVDSLVVTGKYQFLPEPPFAPGKLPAGVVNEAERGLLMRCGAEHSRDRPQPILSGNCSLTAPNHPKTTARRGPRSEAYATSRRVIGNHRRLISIQEVHRHSKSCRGPTIAALRLGYQPVQIENVRGTF